MMKLNWMDWSLQKHIKAATVFLFLGLGFILLSRSSAPVGLDQVEIESPLLDTLDVSIAMAPSSGHGDGF